MLTVDERRKYRSELIAYYFNKQQIKDMQFVRRQVDNMDDRALIKDYDDMIEAIKKKTVKKL